MTKMFELVKTGIKGFDEFLGGGLRKGSAIMLLSPPLIESRLLLLEYIGRGIEANNPGLIITTENSSEDLKSQAQEYGWDLGSGEKKGLLRWIDMYSSRATGSTKPMDTDIINFVPLDNLSDLIINISQVERERFKNQEHRIIFDSFSSVLLHHQLEGRQGAALRFLETTKPKLKENKATGLYALTKGIHEPMIENTLKHIFDGTIEIDENLNVTLVGMSTLAAKGPARMSLGVKGFEFGPVPEEEEEKLDFEEG